MTSPCHFVKRRPEQQVTHIKQGAGEAAAIAAQEIDLGRSSSLYSSDGCLRIPGNTTRTASSQPFIYIQRL